MDNFSLALFQPIHTETQVKWWPNGEGGMRKHGSTYCIFMSCVFVVSNDRSCVDTYRPSRRHGIHKCVMFACGAVYTICSRIIAIFIIFGLRRRHCPYKCWPISRNPVRVIYTTRRRWCTDYLSDKFISLRLRACTSTLYIERRTFYVTRSACVCGVCVRWACIIRNFPTFINSPPRMHTRRCV